MSAAFTAASAASTPRSSPRASRVPPGRASRTACARVPPANPRTAVPADSGWLPVSSRRARPGLAGAVITPAILYGATQSEREGVTRARTSRSPRRRASARKTVYAGFAIIIETTVDGVVRRPLWRSPSATPARSTPPPAPADQR